MNCLKTDLIIDIKRIRVNFCDHPYNANAFHENSVHNSKT